MNTSKKINDTSDFGAEIRRRRRELHYTQAAVSELTGISISFISDLENGKATTELGKAILLASLLGIDITMTPR